MMRQSFLRGVLSYVPRLARLGVRGLPGPGRNAGKLGFITWLVATLALRAVATEASDEVLQARAGLPVRHAVSLRWENDALADTDENYSNGISLAYTHSGKGLLGGLWSWFGAEGHTLYSSYDVGQIMVTPMDTSRPVPDPEDRPYVGMLSFGLSTQMRQGNLFHGLKFVTGVVGPASQADEVQAWFHELIGNNKAQGWAYQLDNEPIFNLVYEHRRRYALMPADSEWGAEVLPVLGAMLGNVLIQAQAGAQLRFGYHLPDDFGTTLMRGLSTLPNGLSAGSGENPPRWGFYLFASGSGVAVARNLTLDGSTFEDSPSVDKKPFFLTGEIGLSIWTRWFEVTGSYVCWGKEFEGQERATRFGALYITVPF